MRQGAMKHLTLTLVVTAVISAIAYYVLTHPTRDQAERLQTELAELEARNDEIRRQNQALREQVVALRDDPRLAERRARQSGGLVKPGELIFKFERPGQEATPVEVQLVARPGQLQLAGADVVPSHLPDALTDLREQLPGAQLQVVFDPKLGPVARQRVRDLVEGSPLAPATYRQADED